ncbi:MAG: proline--tRNA ligase [Christensenellaceae bacterium]|jgi:prolyl-tRNA synthetase|nr:proline--tRNA ligase [Christensenellaceae bacterium]
MLISKLVGSRTKENPADAVIKSHALLIRAGFIKSVAGGIWSFGMPAKKIAMKIEKIIRDEMDGIDGQECSFPVVMPKELWDESGRYSSIGDELVRFEDRNGHKLVLGMTHEEAAVHFARDNITSYQQLPCMIYQIQTKFRDEARSRGGLIRVREFTMKDAYSFHLTQDCLENYYQKVFDAYVRIFKRIGLKKIIAVKSDSGMMGGKISHEFMFLSEMGEDKIVICPHCEYKANMEIADAIISPNENNDKDTNVTEVFTGDAKEIVDVVKFLGVDDKKTIKAVVYNIKSSNKQVICFIRGDLEVNEAKLKKVIKSEIVPVSLAESSEIVAGNIGPMNLKNNGDQIIVYDKSLDGATGMVIGANKAGYHITGVSVARDLKISDFSDISKVKSGMRCIVCGEQVSVVNGIEIGNIFQLGTKYTTSMSMRVLNNNGVAVNPIMGCYGIGVGRALATVAEETADDKGLNWPLEIAPWEVYLCPIRYDNPDVKKLTLELYNEFTNAGIETILDDRNVTPGCKFADSELMGIPIRVVVSPKLLNSNTLEIKLRGVDESKIVLRNDIIKIILDIKNYV